MALSPGDRLGRYEIVAHIGSGGMGDVYRGRDTKLERQVAIKILPGGLGADAERRERFEREARAVSALSHPHICALYDAGHHDGVEYLVMELLEGETLADRVGRGALPPDLALRHGIEIVDALDAAHRQGIVHRDLKPGNVMLTRSGAKLLDFGLAKVGVPSSDLAGLPTVAGNITVAGTVMGTVQYMAPEQLEGRDADARTDVFAFGSVLYEMLTGRRAFEGKSQASLISSIMSAHPPPVSSVQPVAPAALDYVMSRCLAKDPEDRWQSARDLGAELRRIAGQSVSPGGAAAPVADRPARRSARRAAGWLAAAGLVSAIAGMLWLQVRTPGEAPGSGPIHVAIPVAPAERLDGLMAVSPDGGAILYPAHLGDRRQLFVRQLGRSSPVVLAGTDSVSEWGAAYSPDGRMVVLASAGTLKKLPADGGPPTPLGPAALGRPHWGADGRIVFTTIDRGIGILPASGGEVTSLTTVDSAAGELTHEYPHLLPDGRALLFTSRRTDAAYSSGSGVVIRVKNLETGEERDLVRGTAASYLPSGHLVFARDRALLAAPFDVRTQSLTGEPLALFDDVATIDTMPLFAVGGSTLAYLAGGVQLQGLMLTAAGPDGSTDLPVPSRRFSDPRVSPDGTRVVVHVFEEGRDIWIADLRRGTFTRLTFDPGEDETPVWTPDGQWIAYTSTRANVPRAIYRKRADGSGAEELLWSGDGHTHLGGFTPDGRTLVLSIARGRQTDLAALDLRDRSLATLVSSPFHSYEPALSPDGSWLAYTSTESGTSEIYVQPFPSLNGRWQVSTAGGREPVWSRDGRRLFYRAPDTMMVVDVTTAPAFNVSNPKAHFPDRFVSTQTESHTCYDALPDGRLLMVSRPGGQETAATLITLVLGWQPSR